MARKDLLYSVAWYHDEKRPCDSRYLFDLLITSLAPEWQPFAFLKYGRPRDGKKLTSQGHSADDVYNRFVEALAKAKEVTKEYFTDHPQEEAVYKDISRRRPPIQLNGSCDGSQNVKSTPPPSYTQQQYTQQRQTAPRETRPSDWP